MSDYLLQTPACFYFRMKVPQELRSVLQKREIKKSLKTENKQRASRLAAIYAIRCQDMFDALKGRDMTKFPFTTICVDEAQPFADGTYRLRYSTDPRFPEAEERAVNQIIDRLETQAAALKAASSPVFTELPPAPAPQKVSSPGDIRLSEAIRIYSTTIGYTWKDRYKRSIMLTFDILIEIIGDKMVSDITDIDGVTYFDTLQKIPTHRSNTGDLKDQPILKILTDDPEKAFKRRTVNRHIVCVTSLFDWMRGRYPCVTYNPFKAHKVARSSLPTADRDKFDDEELTRLFNDTVFTELDFDAPSDYWLPLIGLYTGMRENEISQLDVADITCVHGVWMFHVTNDAGKPLKVKDQKKSVKSLASKRYVPIHLELFSFGLETLIAARKSEGEIRLFPELPYKNGSFSYKASKDFKRMRRRHGLGLGKDFHSFRHTVATALDRAGLKERQIGLLLGHSTGEKTTGIVYIKPEEAIEKGELMSRLDVHHLVPNVKSYIHREIRKVKSNAHRPKSSKNIQHAEAEEIVVYTAKAGGQAEEPSKVALEEPRHTTILRKRTKQIGTDDDFHEIMFEGFSGSCRESLKQ